MSLQGFAVVKHYKSRQKGRRSRVRTTRFHLFFAKLLVKKKNSRFDKIWNSVCRIER